ncbi:MAG: hypothetical protein LEGION0398_MBIBDBAK_00155 [Legionellaceae bacterium]
MRSFYWENKDKNRYYLIEIKRDLFQDLVLIKTNGRIGSNLGQTRQSIYEKDEDALGEVERIKKVRKQRGYELKDTLEDPRF